MRYKQSKITNSEKKLYITTMYNSLNGIKITINNYVKHVHAFKLIKVRKFKRNPFQKHLFKKFITELIFVVN